MTVKNKHIFLNYILLLIIIFAMLTACGKKDEAEGSTSYQVYFFSDTRDDVIYKEYAIDNMIPMETLNRLVTIMSLNPEEGKYIAPFSNGVNVNNSYIESGTAVIDLNENYLMLNNGEKALLRQAVVKTATQIPGVSDVKFLADGKPILDVKGKVMDNFSAEDFLPSDNLGIMPKESADIVIFLISKNNDSLVPVNRHVEYSGNIPLEYEMVLQLISGSQEDNTKAVINKNTTVNVVKTIDNTCYVDLSKEFLILEKGISEDLARNAITNSLITIEGIDKVVITVDGQ